MGSAFEKVEEKIGGKYDLDEIRRAGELIVGTISSPESYYDVNGIPMGFQYALANSFAETEGLKVRIELAKDTLTLLQMLKQGEVDIVAFPLSKQLLSKNGVIAAGAHDKQQNSWAVLHGAKELEAALNDWYTDDIAETALKNAVERVKLLHQVHRRAQSVYLSKERGIISVYDPLFKRAAAMTGWDWKLLAAQAYQESAFDPNAHSWAGAHGLMQLMPATAAALGLAQHELGNPEKNVEAAARYIRQLTQHFSDVRDANERLKFVLASYNGGLGHVRDAMALTRKYGRDAQKWENVAPFILGLQKPQYYRDPVVRHGYMIGTETEAYVRTILNRWQSYGGVVAITHSPAVLPGEPSTMPVEERKIPKNKYSSGLKIMSPDDPEFNQMKP